MENATQALLMAFAIFIFVIALTVSMVSFTNAKETADAIIYMKDETNYYEYEGAISKAAENRIVGLETIIPTLYKYYKENYTVVFKQGYYNYETGEITDWQYMTIFRTGADRNWQSSYSNLMKKKYNVNNVDNRIFSFDLDEETLRHEPWTGSYDRLKNNLYCFLKGDKYINPRDNQVYIDYSASPLLAGGFIGKYKNDKFLETISEYSYSSSQSNEDNSTISSLTKEKKKRMIIYTRILNN